MARDINDMTMQDIRERAIELGFKLRRPKGQPKYFHWNFSQECKAYQFVLENDPELQDDENDYPDDAA